MESLNVERGLVSDGSSELLLPKEKGVDVLKKYAFFFLGKDGGRQNPEYAHHYIPSLAPVITRVTYHRRKELDYRNL